MSAPYDDVYDAIVDHVSSNWDSSIAVMVFENDSDGAPEGEVAAWVQMVLETSLYGQETIGGGADDQPGGNRWDESGTLWFHIFVPRGTGTREARRIGKALANLFRGRTLLDGNLEFGDADLGAGDPGQENGNYYLMSVNQDWRRMEAQ